MINNLEYCIYTYKHRKAIEYLVNKLIPDSLLKRSMLLRCHDHDMDKMVMYQYLPKKEASRIHREKASHHMENPNFKSRMDYIEAILDYESAGYTKPDKPLNAFDTIQRFEEQNKLNPTRIQELKKVLQDLNINYSYRVVDDLEGMEYLKQFENVTEEMIVKELNDYTERMLY